MTHSRQRPLVFRFRALFLLAALTLTMTAAPLPPFDLYLGTYTRTTSKGIYATRLDPATGALSAPALVAELGNPSWLTLHPTGQVLYAIEETKLADGKAGGSVRAYAIDRTDRSLALLNTSATADPLCHAAVDGSGRVLVAVSYGGGQVSSFPLLPDGRLGARASFIQHSGPLGPNPKRQDKPHAHSATFSPDNRFVFVCDLGQDRVYCYVVDATHATLTPAATPFTSFAPGTGPRHAKFSPDGHRFYVIDELDGTITASAYDAAHGRLAPFQRIATLPSDYAGAAANTTAEIRVHPSGRFLYGSNRGHDSLAVYAITLGTGALTLVEIVDCGGKNPRNFALSPDGAWLVCAHHGADTVVTFRIDPATGRLTRVSGAINVAQPVCVLFTP
jgi:6-phosphogluconolactonase